VTLRSLPRRVRAALAVLEREEVPLDAAGASGESPLAIVDDMARSLMVIDRGLQQVLLHEAPTLLAAVMDPGARVWEQPPGDRHTCLAALDDITAELADRIDGAPGDSWTRTAAIAGGSTASSLDIAREAARTGIGRLRDLEAAGTGQPVTDD